MPVISPERSSGEISARDWQKMQRNLGDFFTDFRPSIARENGSKKCHEKFTTFSTVHHMKFFHCCNSGVGRAMTLIKDTSEETPRPRRPDSRGGS